MFVKLRVEFVLKRRNHGIKWANQLARDSSFQWWSKRTRYPNVEEESNIVMQGGRLTKSVEFPRHQVLLPREAPLLYPIARMSMHALAVRGKGMTLIVLGWDQGSFKSLKKVAKAYHFNVMMDPMAQQISCYPLSNNSMQHLVSKNSPNLPIYVMSPCTSPKPQDNGGQA